MNKKAEVPGWYYVIGLVVGFFLLLFVIWLFTKSGRNIVDQLGWFRS